MSAAAGGHYWAVETLLELGADVNIRNGYMMMPLDYARDQETAQLIYDFMEVRTFACMQAHAPPSHSMSV